MSIGPEQRYAKFRMAFGPTRCYRRRVRTTSYGGPGGRVGGRLAMDRVRRGGCHDADCSCRLRAGSRREESQLSGAGARAVPARPDVGLHVQLSLRADVVLAASRSRGRRDQRQCRTRGGRMRTGRHPGDQLEPGARWPGVGAAAGPCGNTPLLRPDSCHWKATSSTNGWTLSAASTAAPGSAGGPRATTTPSRAPTSARSGPRPDAARETVNGATVTIDGPTAGECRQTRTATTTRSVDPGKYTVSMRAETPKIRRRSAAEEHGGPCDLDLKHTDGVADFTAPPDKSRFTSRPRRSRRTGFDFAGSIDATDSAGQPAAGTTCRSPLRSTRIHSR